VKAVLRFVFSPIQVLAPTPFNQVLPELPERPLRFRVVLKLEPGLNLIVSDGLEPHVAKLRAQGFEVRHQARAQPRALPSEFTVEVVQGILECCGPSDDPVGFAGPNGLYLVLRRVLHDSAS
jgi:hypothetical protein